MRNLQALMQNLFVVVQKYIEIYVTWTFVKNSLPAEAVFDSLKSIE